MTDILTRRVEFGTPDFDLMLALRTEELRIPLGLIFLEKDVAQEYKEIHLGAYDQDDFLAGCLTLKPIDDDLLKMRQVVVDKTYRGQGIGGKLVKESELWALGNNYQAIELNARENAISFYKNLNYIEVGDMFEEVSIRHIKMKKVLS